MGNKLNIIILLAFLPTIAYGAIDPKWDRTPTAESYSLTKYGIVCWENALSHYSRAVESINMKDISGDRFLSSLILFTPSTLVYMVLARNGEIYDFKKTNFEWKAADSNYDHYRGMPIHIGGKQYIASGRDIGNYVAGFVAGYNGLSYLKARLGFDIYQSIKNLQQQQLPSIEGEGTRQAQFLGWLYGHYSPSLRYSFGLK